MNLAVGILLICLLDICAGQTEDASPQDRRLHKHKKRRPYQQPYGSPCHDTGFLRENGGDSDQRSLFAALGGAAVGYHIGTKYPKQPIINNIYNGYPGGGGFGGAPCFPTHSHLGGLGGGLLGSHGHHPLLGSHLGGLGHFGHHRQGVNWDRTIRQFERNIVRPISKWLK